MGERMAKAPRSALTIRHPWSGVARTETTFSDFIRVAAAESSLGPLMNPDVLAS